MKAWLVAGALAFCALDAHSFWRTDIRAVKVEGFSAANSIGRIGVVAFLGAVSPQSSQSSSGGGAPDGRAKSPDAKADAVSGAVVNEDSCATRLEKPLVFTVCSDSDKDDIRPDHEATLRRSLELLEACPMAVAYIMGHGDMDFVPEYSLALANRRAVSVIDRLEAGGIDYRRLYEMVPREHQLIELSGTPEERQECSRGTTITVLIH